MYHGSLLVLAVYIAASVALLLRLRRVSRSSAGKLLKQAREARGPCEIGSGLVGEVA